jgi:F0F1-type ATP synthase assembly protein I
VGKRAFRQSEIYSKVAFYSGLGFILPGAIVAGAALGYFLDGKLGSRPLLAVVLGLLGAVGGFIEIFRLLTREEQQGNQNDPGNGNGSR